MGGARGLVWYLAGTETLSISVYEPIAILIFAWGTVPQFGVGGRARGSGVTPRESPSY